MKKLLFIAALFCSVTLFATDVLDDPNMEIEVRETINKQCVHQVKAFTKHLGFIANKSNPDSIKEYHIEASMDLFVGHGDDTKDDEGNVIIPAPRIEVASMTTGKKNSYFIKQYLVRLKDLAYTKIVFQSSKCYLADGGIRKVAENEYVATVTFYQVFIGYKGDYIVYRDKTEKRVTVHVKKEPTGDFTVLLGDISIQSMTKQ
ncbi:MAG: hypothetical protein IJ756_08105 [Paludibacteraceae bacterium]|nr:hypothetical protein [Paludibacteraceae bacterium]